MADDAVVCEPVSAVKFPGSREFCRELAKKTEFNGFPPDKVARFQWLGTQIPYSSKQGINFGEQGNFDAQEGIEQGNRPQLRQAARDR